MISEGYKSAYQQGYNDAMRDFRKKSKTDEFENRKNLIEELNLIIRRMQSNMNTFGLEFGEELTNTQCTNNHAVQNCIRTVEKRIVELKGELNNEN